MLENFTLTVLSYSQTANICGCGSPSCIEGVTIFNILVSPPDTVIVHALLSQAVNLSFYVTVSVLGIVTLTTHRIAEISISVSVHATMTILVESISACFALLSLENTIIRNDVSFNLLADKAHWSQFEIVIWVCRIADCE